MRPTRLAALPLLLLAVAACGSTAPSASTAPTATAPPPTPVGASPRPSGASPTGAASGEPTTGVGYWLRLTTSQAIPPLDGFGLWPTAIITADGQYLVEGVVPAIYPGPLVIPLFGRQVTDEGRAQIVQWARELGLLDGQADFTGDNAVPGGVTGRIELTVDGSLVSLTGVPDLPTSGSPAPGSPEAFAELWRRVSTLPESLQGQVGPEVAYRPTGYALLVGPPPESQDGIAGNLMDWPLEVALGSFGAQVADGYRCGIVEGADAATLAPSLDQANQLTQWVQDPDTSATFGLTVRPMVGGEDPCAEAFGS
jgi:hypothetical protein